MTEANDHVEELLPLLLTGEATRAEVDLAVNHLRSCADCRDTLVDLVAVHAPLTSAARFAPELMRSTSSAEAAPMPDLTDLFAEVRAEQDEAQRVRTTRRKAPLWLAAAAAAGIVIGGGAVGVATHDNGSSSTGGGRQVALTAFGTGQADASMKVRADGDNKVMTIDAGALPKLADTQRYEVWLTNSARTAMQPVGWLGSDNTARIAVPSNLSDRFSDVEVSVQSVSAPTYEYSGTSVLRGAY